MLKLVKNVPESRHDTILKSLGNPRWLRHGSLLDNVWEIYVKDPGTHSNSTVTLDFNQVVSPWPGVKSLVDPEFENDLITIKLVIFYSLSTSRGWNAAAGSIKRCFSSHLTFVRYRADRGILSNSALNNPWFNEFDRSLKENYLEGLLRLRSRMQTVLEAADQGLLTLHRSNVGTVQTHKLAKLLGVNHGTQITPSARLLAESHFQKKGMLFSRKEKVRIRPVAVPTKITSETAFRYFKVWLDLWDLRDVLTHDPIGYQAFKNKRELRKWFKSWAKKPEKTPDAPEFQTAFLLNQSLKLMLCGACDDAVDLIVDGVDGHDRILNKKKLASLNRRLRENGLGELRKHYYQDGHLGDDGRMYLYHFVFVVSLAIARIIKAAFSARRDEEIETNQIDCIETDQAGNVWLRCLIVKNLDRVDKVPVPKCVEQAVKLVKRIRDLGARPGNKLYQFACPIKKRNVEFDLAGRLDIVRDYLKIPLMEDDTAWHFTPHQFRKFFGVVYFWKWAFPNLTALTLQYRHFNPDVTKGYIELKAAEALRLYDTRLAKAARKIDIARAADFDSGRVQFVRFTLQKVVAGEKMGGPLGRRITAQVEALKSQFLPSMQITESKTDQPSFEVLLEELVQSTTIQRHPEGHSLCGCGNGGDDAELSQCLSLKQMLAGVPTSAGSGPDFNFAEDGGCLVCPHRGSLKDMSPYWHEEILAIERALPLASENQAREMNARRESIEQYA